MTEAKVGKNSEPTPEADDRDYEAPKVTALGKIGELTNESAPSTADSF